MIRANDIIQGRNRRWGGTSGGGGGVAGEAGVRRCRTGEGMFDDPNNMSFRIEWVRESGLFGI